MSTPTSAPAALDIAAVRGLRFEIGLYLDEIARQAKDTLEAVGIARAKLAELERACEAGPAAAPTATPTDTE